MKTKELTFQQALKALDEDKCIGIRPESFMTNNYYKETDDGHLSYFIPRTNVFILKSSLSLSTLLGKWNLVTGSIPTPKTEQRIFNYWIVIFPDGTTELYDQKPTESTCKTAQYVFERCQTYTFNYPRKESEERIGYKNRRTDNTEIP